MSSSSCTMTERQCGSVLGVLVSVLRGCVRRRASVGHRILARLRVPEKQRPFAPALTRQSGIAVQWLLRSCQWFGGVSVFREVGQLFAVVLCRLRFQLGQHSLVVFNCFRLVLQNLLQEFFVLCCLSQGDTFPGFVSRAARVLFQSVAKCHAQEDARVTWSSVSVSPQLCWIWLPASLVNPPSESTGASEFPVSHQFAASISECHLCGRRWHGLGKPKREEQGA